MSIREDELRVEIRERALLMLATLGISARVQVSVAPVHADKANQEPTSWIAGVVVDGPSGYLGHAGSSGATPLQALERFRKHMEVEP